METTGLGELVKEQLKLDYWKSIMQTRSEGWLVMQLMLDMFPENSGVVITSCEYSVTGAQPGAGSARGPNAAKGMGYNREWRFLGYSTVKGRTIIKNLGSDAAMRIWFEDFAKKYKSAEFELEKKGRTVKVNLGEDVNTYAGSSTMSKEEAAQYTTSFNLVITQTMAATDELAIPLTTPK